MEVRVVSDPGFIEPKARMTVKAGVVDIDNPILYVPVEMANNKAALADVCSRAKSEIRRRDL